MKRFLFLVLALVLVSWRVSYGVMHNVAMLNFVFSPDTLVVFQGDTVLWINQSSLNHTTTSGINGVPDSIWDSGLMAPSDSFVFYFGTMGDYPYFCTPHWPMGMIGFINVIATGAEESEFNAADIPFLTVYPALTKSMVVIVINPEYQTDALVNIYDSKGSQVKKVYVDNDQDKNRLIWNLKDEHEQRVQPGIYFIRALGKGRQNTSKLIVIE